MMTKDSLSWYQQKSRRKKSYIIINVNERWQRIELCKKNKEERKILAQKPKKHITSNNKALIKAQNCCTHNRTTTK